jgi:hypothetical protein
MSGMECRLCRDARNPLDVSAVTTESDKRSDATKNSKVSYVKNVPSKLPMLERTSLMTNKRAFLNRLEDKNGNVIFSGEFVEVYGRPKCRYLFLGVISKHGTNLPRHLVYDVHENICSQIYYSSILRPDETVNPSVDQLEAMEKSLTVVIDKINKSKKLVGHKVGLKPLSSEMQRGEQLPTADNDIRPPPEKSKY